MITSDNTASSVIENGISAALILFVRQTVMQTIPWLICVIPLLIIDGIVGVRASKYRYSKKQKEEDRFTFSKLLKKTIGKVFEYISWVIFGAALSVALHKDAVAWAVLFLPVISEMASIWGHKLELKDIELNFTNLWRLIFRKGSEKVGVSVDKEEVEQIIKPKRDARGRFIKKQ